ncbi:MAG: FkbM family methyltransferase [Candidatus Omnitrophota bacterium]|nr:FkbM family methyltransferase [Candidatus Omnitrophota bacterium]
MLKLKKKIKKKLLKLFGGKKRHQGLFEKMHELSLAGMNYGGGDNIAYSGEENVIDYLVKHMVGGQKPTVFDIGANAGEYTLRVAKAFDDAAFIYSFEPLKAAFKALCGNIKGRVNIKVYNFGFGPAGGRVPIYFDRIDSTLASLFPRRMDHLGVDNSRSEEIEVRTLDDFCKENGISRINLLKIDTEGGEIDVLKGSVTMLDSGSIDIIQFEFGGFNIASRTFFQDFFYLLSPCFKIYRILKDGFAEVTAYKEAQEVFLTTNYMAVSKNFLKRGGSDDQ